MQVFRRIMVAAVAAAAIGACAPATEQARNTYPVRSSKAQLVVQNQNWQDVTVYLLSSNAKIRLGTVTSMSKGSFEIPDAYVLGVSDINVQADPIGSGRTFVSGPIQVYPGARVELRVENAIQLSNFAVYKVGI